MIDLPTSTVFGKRITKRKFYENIDISSKLRQSFTEQISQIVWQNKIAPSTTNIAHGEHVEEIEVIAIKLNQRSIDPKVLSQIDKNIPYHILFLLEYNDEVQAWIGFKEASQTKQGTFKAPTYYHTDWMQADSLKLHLNGLNMDTVYESLIRQIAADRLEADETPDAFDIKEAIERDEQRQKQKKEIAVLEKKIQKEKQFNRQVEMNEELKRLRRLMEGL